MCIHDIECLKYSIIYIYYIERERERETERERDNVYLDMDKWPMCQGSLQEGM